jgi:hypothetical protein
MRSMTDEGESLTLLALPHPVGSADHLLPREKEERRLINTIHAARLTPFANCQ